MIRYALLLVLFSGLGWAQNCANLIWNPIGGERGTGSFDCVGTGVSTATIQSGQPIFVRDATTTDSQFAGCPSPAITQLTNGMLISLSVLTANQSGVQPSFNLCGLGARTILDKNNREARFSGSLFTNNPALLSYNTISNFWVLQERPSPIFVGNLETSGSTVHYVIGGTIPVGGDGLYLSYLGRGVVYFSPISTNTGAADLAIAGTPAIAITRYDGSPTAAGDLVGGAWYALAFDGTNFRMAPNTTTSLSVTTKGDVQTFTTVPARQAVGADGTQLTADSSKASGLDWKVPPVAFNGINAQTGNYSLLSTDCGKLVTENGTSLTATLTNPPPSATCVFFIENLNATSLTISRNSLTINGGATNVTLLQKQMAVIWTDGSNYFGAVIPAITTSPPAVFNGTNSQTINYALLSTDCGELVLMNGSSLTTTLTSPPPSATCVFFVENLNSTALTISRNSLTINGDASNITLLQKQMAILWTDGTNYFGSIIPMDNSGNIQTPGAIQSGVGSGLSGVNCPQGATSGSQCFSVADIAGTHVGIVWPSADGTTGQTLSLGAQVACSSLIATWPTVPNFTFPTNCRQFSYVTPASGGAYPINLMLGGCGFNGLTYPGAWTSRDSTGNSNAPGSAYFCFSSRIPVLQQSNNTDISYAFFTYPASVTSIDAQFAVSIEVSSGTATWTGGIGCWADNDTPTTLPTISSTTNSGSISFSTGASKVHNIVISSVPATNCAAGRPAIFQLQRSASSISGNLTDLQGGVTLKVTP